MGLVYRLLLAAVVSAVAVHGQTAATCDASCQSECGTKISQCMAGFPTSGPSPETCTAIKTVESCFERDIVPRCLGVPGINASVKSVRDAVPAFCSEAVQCAVHFRDCMLPMRPANPNDTVAVMAKICSGWPTADECLDNIPDSCASQPEIRQSIAHIRAYAEAVYYMACDPKGGVCPDIFGCFVQGRAVLSSEHADNKDNVTVELDAICRLTPMLECFHNVSLKCGIDQGTVTFQQIKDVVVDLCQNVLPYADRMLQCPQFQTCARQALKLNEMNLQFDGFTELSQEQVRQIANRAVNYTRTGYWCWSLKGNYKCALDNAENCGIPASGMTVTKQQYGELSSMCDGAATVAPRTDDTSTGDNSVAPQTDKTSTGDNSESGAKRSAWIGFPVVMVSAIFVMWFGLH